MTWIFFSCWFPSCCSGASVSSQQNTPLVLFKIFYFTNKHAKCTQKTHPDLPLPLPLPLPLTITAFPSLISPWTNKAFNSGDTSFNGMFMGFPPFLFGAVSLELRGAGAGAGAFSPFSLPAPTIDFALSSFRLRLGICCWSGSGFIWNESSNIDLETQAERRTCWEYPLQAVNRELQGGDQATWHWRNPNGGIFTYTTRTEKTSIQEQNCHQLWAQSEFSFQVHDRKSAVDGTCLWFSFKQHRDLAYLTFSWWCHLWPRLLFPFFFWGCWLSVE